MFYDLMQNPVLVHNADELMQIPTKHYGKLEYEILQQKYQQLSNLSKSPLRIRLRGIEWGMQNSRFRN